MSSFKKEIRYVGRFVSADGVMVDLKDISCSTGTKGEGSKDGGGSQETPWVFELLSCIHEGFPMFSQTIVGDSPREIQPTTTKATYKEN